MWTRSAITAGIMAALAGAARAQSLTTIRVADGMSAPLFAGAPPGDHARLFIVEQNGSGGIADQAMIRILHLATSTLNAAPFLSVRPVGSFLGLAFDPGYATTGRFFVYSVSAGTISVTRYTVSANPDIADPGSAAAVLTLANPAGAAGDHWGGWMGFGPDGYLYIAIGDGGPWYDPFGRAQDLTQLFGKILRLDVSGAAAAIPAGNPFAASPIYRQEIWAYGLRNPWRASFDRATGDLWIADVGQDLWEEIDFQAHTAGPPFAAANYGWRCFEADSVQNTTVGPGGAACNSITNFTFPIYAYAHPSGCSVIGGYVYRGRAVPSLRGAYFFADWCSGRITSLECIGGAAQNITDRTAELARPGFAIDSIVSFGEDGDGELYICDQGGGEVYKIVPRCEANCDGSTTPPIVNVGDFGCFLNAFAAGDPYGNCDGSTAPPVLNVADFGCFINRFVAGCS